MATIEPSHYSKQWTATTQTQGQLSFSTSNQHTQQAKIPTTQVGSSQLLKHFMNLKTLAREYVRATSGSTHQMSSGIQN